MAAVPALADRADPAAVRPVSDPGLILERVRLYGDALDPALARLRLGSLLAGAELRPPGLPPSAVLCVRRVVDPLPGALRLERPEARPPPDWERALVAALERALRGAARPAHGPVPAAAEAVLFADRAELLACLARDERDGTAWLRWWWRGLRLLPAGDPDPAVTAWLETPEHVPAALELLAARGDAVRFVAGLSEGDATSLVLRVAAAHALPELRRAAAGVPVSRPPGREHARADTAAPSPRPPWRSLVPESVERPLEPAAELLLGAGLALRRAPQRARAPAFAAATRAWLAAGSPPPRPVPVKGPLAAPAAPPRPAEPERMPQPPAAHDGRSTEALATGAPEAARPPRPSRPRGDIRAAAAPSGRGAALPGGDRARPIGRRLRRGAARRARDPAACRARDAGAVRRAGGARRAASRRVASRPGRGASAHCAGDSRARRRGRVRRPVPRAAGARGRDRARRRLLPAQPGALPRPLRRLHAPARAGDRARPMGSARAARRRPCSTSRRATTRSGSCSHGSPDTAPASAPGRGFRPPRAWRTPADWLEPFDHDGEWRWSAARGTLRILHPAGFAAAAVPRTPRPAREQLARELRRLRALAPEPRREVAAAGAVTAARPLGGPARRLCGRAAPERTRARLRRVARGAAAAPPGAHLRHAVPRRRRPPARRAAARDPDRRARPDAGLDSRGRALRRPPLRMSAGRRIDELPRTPATHFRLHVYGAVLALRERLPPPDEENGLGFLAGYYEELDEAGPQEPASWWARLDAWEREARGHLPLRALREAYGLDPLALALLFTAGLAEEDGRFGTLFEAMSGVVGETRPTLGCSRPGRMATRRTRRCARCSPPGCSRRPTRRRRARAGRSRCRRCSGTRCAGGPPTRRPAGRAIVRRWSCLRSRRSCCPTRPRRRSRGCRGCSRPPIRGRSSSAARARADVARPSRPSRASSAAACSSCSDPAASVRLGGPLATLLHALPLVVLDPAPGETVQLPALHGYAGPLAAVAGRSGGVRAERALTVWLGLPDPFLREEHWRQALGDPELAFALAPGLRTTAGAIRRVADLARAEAALAGRPRPEPADVQAALRTLEAEELETLATRVPLGGGWEQLAVGAETGRELELLERRCRARERLHESVGEALGAQLTPGVRALFSGPSGTGKTLAARLLASSLGKGAVRGRPRDGRQQVPRRDGEEPRARSSRAPRSSTSCCCSTRATRCSTRRTDVQTSNDRYANLETNFLLQRLESFEGILVVTTNTGDRIDPAFRRRHRRRRRVPRPGRGRALGDLAAAPAAPSTRPTTRSSTRSPPAAAHRRPDPQRRPARVAARARGRRR